MHIEIQKEIQRVLINSEQTKDVHTVYTSLVNLFHFGYQYKGTLTNSEDTDEMSHKNL